MGIRSRALVVLLSLGLVAAACGDSSSSKSAESSGGAGATSTTAAPQIGGTITFGEFSEPTGLDPIVSTGHGTTGAIEMAAVFDTILRYNHTTKKYENRMAESVTANGALTEWTITLKPGIKFTDGTAYDADAVVFGLNRHRSGLPGTPACDQFVACPRNATPSNSYMALVKDIQAVDALTVKVTLSEPWNDFPYVLASEPGMIPSPTALKQCDATKPASQCSFSRKPVGAGPFVVQTFAPKEGITMVRNPSYWGGPVYLDGLKFLNMGDGGGMKTLEAYKVGTLQAAFLRAPDAVAAAHEQQIPGFSTMEQFGQGLRFNVGVSVTCAGGKPEPVCTGKSDGIQQTNPVTKDLKVRQAIAAALDPKVIDQRATGGKGFASSDFLQSDFPWFPNLSGPKYSADDAKRLVAEAKAAGWNGKVRLLFNNTPTSANTGLAVQALLQAVGIDAQLDANKDTATFVQTYLVNHDFDIVGTGTSVSPDEGAMVALTQNLSSTSPSNYIGYSSPVVDQGLKDLRAARTDAEKTAAYKKIVGQIYADLPVYALAKVEEYTIWSPKVHGMTETMRAAVLFDKAWIEK